MSADPFAQLKAAQREGWSLFAPLETHTTIPAAELVRHARIREGQAVLDLACGTGVVAVTAARLGARVSALDLSPALLEHARRHAALADVKIDFREGDVEALPYENAGFDVVVSQFGHEVGIPQLVLPVVGMVMKAIERLVDGTRTRKQRQDVDRLGVVVQ